MMKINIIRFLANLFKRKSVTADQNFLKPTKLQKQAEGGDAEAQFFIGTTYTSGKGVKQDDAKAVKWFRRAVEIWSKGAEQNDADAQFNLGCCYANGQAVVKDKVEAYAWFSWAAKADSDAAGSRDLLRKELTPKQFTDAQKRMKEMRWQITPKSKSSAP